MKLLIGNINVNNDKYLESHLGVAGYIGCLKLTDMCNGVLDCGSAEDRKKLAIKNSEIKKMIGGLIMDGFTCQVQW